MQGYKIHFTPLEKDDDLPRREMADQMTDNDEPFSIHHIWTASLSLLNGCKKKAPRGKP